VYFAKAWLLSAMAFREQFLTIPDTTAERFSLE
jgi:hypothetical protein